MRRTGTAPGRAEEPLRRAWVLGGLLLAWAVAGWAGSTRVTSPRGEPEPDGPRPSPGATDTAPTDTAPTDTGATDPATEPATEPATDPAARTGGSPVRPSRRTVVTVNPGAGATVNGYLERLVLVLIGEQATPAQLAKDDR